MGPCSGVEKKKKHWIGDEDIWILGLAPYDLGHDTSLALTFPLLCEENIHQMISEFFILSVKLSLHVPSGARRDDALTSDGSDRKCRG